ncbi:MAG: hypothetical protein LBI28_02595 [Treponema sp.]|nr:hypothetical protein [Treponema sp.]
MPINSEKMRSPQFIFIVYTLAAIVLIMIFRFIFPGSPAPLLIYSRSWRIVQGLLEVLNLFPAIALSALVIPFGIATIEENYQSFSDVLFKRLLSSVVIAICAAVIYGIVFFFALPMLKNYEGNLQYSGELYRISKIRAQESMEAGEWLESSKFIELCDRIWVKSPELTTLRDTVAIRLSEKISEENEEKAVARAALLANRRATGTPSLSKDQQPVNASQAISMSRDAFNQRRYFDAHWLANLGMMLAERGSVEAANATILASDAWNMIGLQAPTQLEERHYELYNLKLSGYQAMENGEWIRAFYIFQELLEYTPDDPDAKNFFAASERNAKDTAFFVDEIELTLGEILNGAVFSLPSGNGRAVLRFNSLTTSADVAYGIGFEYMEFDMYMAPKISVASIYAKLVPFTLNGKQKVLVLTHALDRSDQEHTFQNDWLLGAPSAGGLLLDVSYEDLLLISDVRHGLPHLQIDELFSASKKLNDAGYVYQIFQAEILNRLGSALFFLPIAIFVIIMAWRYRARQRPRYLFFLLLPILPIVFHGFVFLYRSVFNILGIWLVLSIGFSAALAVYIAALAVTLFISLIALSAQHS